MVQKNKSQVKARSTKPAAVAKKKAPAKAVAAKAPAAVAPKGQTKPSVTKPAAPAKKTAPVVAGKPAAQKPTVPSQVKKTVAPAAVAAVAGKKPAHPAPAVAAPAGKAVPQPHQAKPSVAKAAPQQAPKAASPLVARPGHAPSTLVPPAQRPIAVQPPHARTVPAQLGKGAVTGNKISAPVGAPHSGHPASPKAIAEKAAAAAAAAKKPVNQRHGFKLNESIVYPAHGVGRIVGIEEQEIAGMSLELFVITFDKEKLTLRVPTGKLVSVGMRKLADDGVVKKAMETLKGRARIKRTMWSRRAQEYVAKINSGDLVSIAEVVRDLYRSEAQPEQSYSERQLYEDALDRMARELAAVEKLDDRGAVQRITEVLSKSARGRRAEGEAEPADEAEVKAA